MGGTPGCRSSGAGQAMEATRPFDCDSTALSAMEVQSKDRVSRRFLRSKNSRNCRNFAALQKDCSEFESPRLRGAATVTEGKGVAYLMTDHVARNRPFLKD